MVRGAEDLKHLMSQLSETHTDTSSQRTLVVDATDWKVRVCHGTVLCVWSTVPCVCVCVCACVCSLTAI